MGDTSIDLPEATCLIQISSHYGSRRQEAQRLGRILRAKRRGDEGFNAFFYSLVSQDTEEMYYSSKRQQFLIDQGYSFKIVTHLKGMTDLPDLVYATPNEQLELLKTILIATEAEVAEEDVVGAGLDDFETNPEATTPGTSTSGSSMARRTLASAATLSGASDMAYMETNRPLTSTAIASRPRHPLFKARYRK